MRKKTGKSALRAKSQNVGGIAETSFPMATRAISSDPSQTVKKAGTSDSWVSKIHLGVKDFTETPSHALSFKSPLSLSRFLTFFFKTRALAQNRLEFKWQVDHSL